MQSIMLSAIMIFMLMLSIALPACGGGSSERGSKTNVYTGGYCLDSSSKYHTCYWKKGTRVDLPNSESASSSAEAF